jgi:hypothetical protein
MVTTPATWQGNIDISALADLFNDGSIFPKQCYQDGLLQGLNPFHAD